MIFLTMQILMPTGQL